MFDRIGDESRLAAEPGLGGHAVEHLSGWADKGTAREILLIAGLFTDHHQIGAVWPFARHGLGRMAMQRAAGAGANRGGQVLHRAVPSG